MDFLQRAVAWKLSPPHRPTIFPGRFLRAVPVAVWIAATMVPAADAITLVNAVSRKVHGVAGPFDLPIQPAATINGPLSIESRVVGSGHLILFTFDEAVINPGTVSVVDANSTPVGNVATPAVNGQVVEVSIADVPDRRRVNVTLAGVTGASGSTNATIFLGFLVGDFNDSGGVSALDVTSCKARAGQAVDLNSFRFDTEGTGFVTAADIAATKSRIGLFMITGQPPLTWQQGGWDLDVWQ